MSFGQVHKGESEQGAKLLEAIFEAWRAEGLEFLVLRNYDKLPLDAGNDLDVLVELKSRAKAEALVLATAETFGYTLVNRAEFSPVSLYLCSKETGHVLQIDLFASLAWRGFMMLGADAVLGRRQARKTFFVPHPVDEAALNLLTRLLYTGRVKAAYRDGIASIFSANEALAQQVLRPLFGTAAERVVELAAAQDWRALEGQTTYLRYKLASRQLTLSPVKTLSSFVSDIKRLSARLRHPPGLAIAVDEQFNRAALGELERRLAAIFDGVEIAEEPKTWLAARRIFIASYLALFRNRAQVYYGWIPKGRLTPNMNVIDIKAVQLDAVIDSCFKVSETRVSQR